MKMDPDSRAVAGTVDVLRERCRRPLTLLGRPVLTVHPLNRGNCRRNPVMPGAVVANLRK